MKTGNKKYGDWFIIGTVLLVIVLVIRKIKQKNMVVDITDKLPRRGEYSQRGLDAIDKVVIHHSASPAGRFTMADYANWHIDPNGRLDAQGIAYHFGVFPDGRIYQSNRLESVSWHAGNANKTAIGIVLDGNFENEQPTPAQKRSLKKLIRYLRGKLKKKLAVYGHREIPGNLTACPGRNINLEEFR